MVPYLVATSGSNSGLTYLLGDRTLIGRSSDADVQVLEAEVSRRHALILKGPDGRFRIGDLASTNGTFICGDRASGGVVKVGDTIQVASSSFLFLQAVSLEEVVEGLGSEDLKLLSGPARGDTMGLDPTVVRQLLNRKDGGIPSFAANRAAKRPTQKVKVEADWLDALTQTTPSVVDPRERTKTVQVGTHIA